MILLSYTIPIASSGFDIDDNSTIRSFRKCIIFQLNESFSRFAQDSLTFQCRYSRSINVNQDIIIGTIPQIITGEGSLNYEMTISGGDLGGMTEVRLTPLHSFNQITPRLHY